MHTLEKEGQLQHAQRATSWVCLLDRDGRVTSANRPIERGSELHQALHPNCSTPGCYLVHYWRRNASLVTEGRHAEREVLDPVFNRPIRIRLQGLLHQAAAEFPSGTPVAILSIEETTHDSSPRDSSSFRDGLEGEVDRQSEKFRSHLLTIMDRAPAFTAMADRDGELFYLNGAGRALIGMQGDLSGLTLFGCIVPGARVRMAREALPTAEREGVWSGDSALLTVDGKEVRVFMTLIAHRDQNESLEGFSLLARDTSDWLRAEEALRATRAQLWRLSAQHLNIQETERRRIALELHDGLGQTLSLVKFSIEEASSVGAEAPAKMVKVLERLSPQVKSALAELRRIAMNLRPSTLDDLGIVATLSWYFRELEMACANLTLESEISVMESDVPDALKISIFRIVQEATSNAVKHAKAHRIKVGLSCLEGRLALLIEDDGNGFDPTDTDRRRDFNHGVGLQSMKERAELSGGCYELRSAPGEGTRIEVIWFLSEDCTDQCPVLPMHEGMARARCESAPNDDGLEERFSTCLACVRAHGRE